MTAHGKYEKIPVDDDENMDEYTNGKAGEMTGFRQQLYILKHQCKYHNSPIITRIFLGKKTPFYSAGPADKNKTFKSTKYQLQLNSMTCIKHQRAIALDLPIIFTTE